MNVEKDKGYAATTTLSGTRLATDLRDTAGSLSIMTPELMADLPLRSGKSHGHSLNSPLKNIPSCA